MTKKEINNLFDKLIAKLQEKTSIKFSNNFSDGRINSIANEQKIIEKIILVYKKYVDKIIEPKARNWYDLAFIKNGHFIPFNIKITSNFSNDNVSSKSALFWTFFNVKTLDMKNSFSWKKFNYIFENKKVPKKYRDYYFLIINKNDTKDIFYTSFKQLKKIAKNRNNLPFQANWAKNRELIDRSEKEAFIFCFKPFYEGLQDLKSTSKTLDNIKYIIKKNYENKNN